MGEENVFIHMQTVLEQQHIIIMYSCLIGFVLNTTRWPKVPQGCFFLVKMQRWLRYDTVESKWESE